MGLQLEGLLTADLANGDCFSDNEVHDGLVHFLVVVRRPILEDGIEKLLYRLPSLLQRRLFIRGGTTRMQNLETALQLGLLEIIRTLNRPRRPQDGIAVLQGCEQALAGALVGSSRGRGASARDPDRIRRVFSLEWILNEMSVHRLALCLSLRRHLGVSLLLGGGGGARN